ncbi:MAG: DegT/DnrJ/EryC1/StrS family aminotransferase [Xanthobacteraceae bacterium]|nr:DegT/DnrJ/EryC1/StrS family aminotransferase [Xanthobacteraceae bacterium]
MPKTAHERSLRYFRRIGKQMKQAPSAIPFNDLSRQARLFQSEFVASIAKTVQSGRYIQGSEHNQFEKEFSEYCGTQFAIGVANGSDALEIALRAAGVERGQSVLTVANAGGYATAAILAIGARPLYADVDIDTHLIDLEAFANLISSAPVAAVVITHLFGRMADVARVTDTCARKGIPVIEDCAQAHGAQLGGRMAGSIGAAGCFSFYPTKNLGALGDGGAITTNDPGIADKARSLRQYGWNGKYKVALSGGRNSRLDEIQAAVLRIKLPKLRDWNERRRAIANRYCSGLRHDKIRCLGPSGPGDVVHLFVARCSDRDGLRDHLRVAEIGSDVHYPIPDHLQPAWSHINPNTRLPVTERLASEIVSLPCYPELSDDEVDRIIDRINGW